MKRLLMAIGIAAAIYGLSASIGLVLYATGNIATGATHNDCADIKAEIAAEQGIAEEDVVQSELAARTQACLDEHELTPEYALRTEYLTWPLWGALVAAGVFLMWPLWTRVLENQDIADPAQDAPRLEMGQ